MSWPDRGSLMPQPLPGSSVVAIRDARVEDAPQIAHVLLAMGWFSGLKGMSQAEVEANVREQLSVLLASEHSDVWVAETEAPQVVGYCSVHWLADLFLPRPEGYLSELFVLPESRGRGIGRALLDRVVSEARKRGAYRLMLINGKHRESYQRGFYSKHGWEERELMANFVYWVRDDDPAD